MVSRRAYVRGALGAGAVALAGCATVGSRSAPTDRATDSPTDGSTVTPKSTATPEPTTSHEPYELSPGEYDVVVVFRNDDPQPDYAFEALQAVEEVFVEAGVPLTHGVIPAIDGPLERDSNFCRHLRRQASDHPGYFEFALHGYAHEEATSFYGGSEFGGLPPKAQRDRITAGSQILADCLDVRPTAFIPPFNTYDALTVDAVREAGIACVSGGSWFTEQFYEGATPPFETGEVLHVPSTAGFVSDWQTGAFYDQEALRAAFDEAVETTGLHVQMLHYPDFATTDRLDQLRALLRYVTGREGVGYMTLSGFAAAYSAGHLRRTEAGWHYDPA